MARSRLLMIVAGVVVLAVGAVALALQPWAPSGQEPGPAPAAAASPPSPGSPEALAVELTTTLASADQDAVAQVFAAPTEQLNPDLAAALAKLDVVVDPATFEQVDETAATVSATTSGPDGPGRWTLYLTRADDRWLIAATAPAEQQ